MLPPVHPHARGEHRALLAVSEVATGSSPRSWGTRPPTRCMSVKRRFIPTLVGNTVERDAVRAIAAVHPHARGEHLG